MHTLSSLQAGARLVASATRDPAPILNLTTFWDFMKVIEAAVSLLTDAEKASSLYLDHVACYDRIWEMHTDMTPVGNDHTQLGEHFTEALAAYADQAADLLPLLLEHGDDPAQVVMLLQEFEGVLATVVEEIHEVPGGPAIQLALAAFKQCHEREQAEALYDQVLDLFDQQQYEACLALLDQAICLDPGNAHLHFGRGNTRYELKDFRGAAADYLWALKRAPFFADAMINLGNVYALLKQYEKSLALYERAAALAPENAYIPYNRANTLVEAGHLPEAIEAFTTAITLMPEFADAYLNRGTTLSRVGKHQEALADYDQAQKLTPDDSNNTWTVCWAHFGNELLTDQVVQELERISHLDPKHYTSQMCLAVIALSREATQESLFHLEQAVTAEPEQWDPHFWIGLVAAMTGETEVALQAIEHSLELGLPPLLLTPLRWLKEANTDFFEQYASGLFQRFNL